MSGPTNRRKFIAMLASGCAGAMASTFAQSENPDRRQRKAGGTGRHRPDGLAYVLPSELEHFSILSLVLGRASDRSATVSALVRETAEGFFELGTAPGRYSRKTAMLTFPQAEPVETVFDQLQADTRYYYRLQTRKRGDTAFQARAECTFHTQRKPGSAFTFTIQGDSHPERPQMSEPNLYARTLLAAAAAQPDFHICMGDDFSVAPVHEVNPESIGERYTLQRPFLGLVGRSAPVFLVNGNHEQASLFNYNQPDVRHQVAVLAQSARNRYYPTPAPDDFYSGDTAPLKDIGLRKDYCAWTWGDALFVILDNYWHSPVQVDSGFQDEEAGGGGGGGMKDHRGGRQRDWWHITLGDTQYHWFKRTLEQSTAKFKFVFAHHVMGTGRGGIDECDLYEWGGRNKRGDWEFSTMRPGWELPVHQLMAKHRVSVFFQGHDHLFARQERDGIVYQEVPMPADPGYFAYNSDRYQSGVKLPNSGYLRVTVSPDHARVEYIRSYLPKDESAGNLSGAIAHSYIVKAAETHG
jgi:hypothetical protein